MRRDVPFPWKFEPDEKSITKFARELGLNLLPYQEKFLEEIADKVHNGVPLSFTTDVRRVNVHILRKILQRLAVKYNNDGDPVRAFIALREAEKLNPAELERDKNEFIDVESDKS